MKQIFHILFLAAFCLLTATSFAQTAEPTVSFHSIDEDADIEMKPGESQSAQAPLELKMQANLSGTAGWESKCEWRLYDQREGETKAKMKRFDENTTYTLTKAGGYGIKFYVTFTNADGDELEYESEPFTVSISESKLSCPDGFSPNGDGINDVFKITCQSIVKLSGTIANRWGKKVYSFNLSNVAEGWDGRSGGEVVKDGVYFLNLQAVGSDGVKYDIKKAINVLTSFREREK